MSKQTKWLDDNGVLALRKQITLGSVFVADYRNTLGVDENNACAFFDGFVSYIEELAEEDGFSYEDVFDLYRRYDTDENLLGWFNCYDQNPLPVIEKENEI